MFCTNCGNNLGVNDKFCASCGKEIRITQPEKHIPIKKVAPVADYDFKKAEPTTLTNQEIYQSEKKTKKERLSEEHRNDLKKLLEEKSGKEATEEEINEAENWMYEFASVLLDMAESQWKKDQKLKEHPKGFHLDGHYSCAICGYPAVEENSWYDKYGIKCLLCQKAIDKKIIPGTVAKNKDSWYSKYDLESRFNIKHHALKRLIKENVLKPRIVYSLDNRPHIYLFLVKDHKDTLPPKKLTESRGVTETIDGKQWFRSEPWYRFIDPAIALKDYKIMDYLVVTFDEKEREKNV